jgi:hypothetical protein
MARGKGSGSGSGVLSINKIFFFFSFWLIPTIEPLTNSSSYHQILLE